MSANVGIFGSCVTRDALGFCGNAVVQTYIARQSLVSAFSKTPSEEVLMALKIAEDAHEFYKRNIFNDFHKESKNIIRDQKHIDFWIIDLIEERTPLGVTDCGAFLTYSQAHAKFSNSRSLMSSFIQPFTENYSNAFSACIDDVSSAFAGKRVVCIRRFMQKMPGLVGIVIKLTKYWASFILDCKRELIFLVWLKLKRSLCGAVQPISGGWHHFIMVMTTICHLLSNCMKRLM